MSLQLSHLHTNGSGNHLLYMVRMTMLRVQVRDHAHVTESLSQAGKL